MPLASQERPNSSKSQGKLQSYSQLQTNNDKKISNTANARVSEKEVIRAIEDLKVA